MEKLGEKLQEEAWSKIKPLLEWHRLVSFILLNLLISPGFLELFVQAIETKALNDIPGLLTAISRELKIKDILWTALLCFSISPWLSSKLNWFLLNKIQIKLARALINSLRNFAEVLSTTQSIPGDQATSIYEKEQRSLSRFRFLKTACEVWIVLIPVAYVHLLEPNHTKTFLMIVLTALGFFGISQLMMVLFLRDIAPAVLIRHLKELKKNMSHNNMEPS